MNRSEQGPLISYFAATFGLTWSGIALIVALHGWEPAAIGGAGMAGILLAMVLGPSISGVLLTQLFDGREGLLDLWRRWTNWRVGWPWYAFGLLTVPVLLVTISLALARLADPVFAPRFEPGLLLAGLLVGALEETGWTGFATPRLLRQYSTLIAGLGLGFIWAVWHVFADYAGNSAAMGADWFVVFAVFWIAPLPAYRVLMTWVYARTESVLMNALMHASYTGSLLAFAPATPLGMGLMWQGVFACSLWVVVLGVLAIGKPGGRTERQNEQSVLGRHWR
jgi:membrane protease YdiL (CAAX protease family)